MRTLTVDEVIDAVCEVCSKRGIAMSKGWILSKDQQAVVVLPRHVSMFVCRYTCGMGLSELGNAFNRNHTTVYYAANNLLESMQFNPRARAMVTEVYAELGIELEIVKKEGTPKDPATAIGYTASDEVKVGDLLARELEEISYRRMSGVPGPDATDRQRNKYSRAAYQMSRRRIHMHGCKYTNRGSRVVSNEAFEEGVKLSHPDLCSGCLKKYHGAEYDLAFTPGSRKYRVETENAKPDKYIVRHLAPLSGNGDRY